VSELNTHTTTGLLVESETKRMLDDYDRYHRMTDVYFAGVQVSQHRCEFVLWETILNDNPDLRAVFELGTWHGGFSGWLWAQCELREMHFRTFDRDEPPGRVRGFTKLNVFSDPDAMQALVAQWEPLLVFCDNGNKPRELKLFSRFVSHPGSLLMVHDWGEEIFPSDVPRSLEMVYGGLCDELDSMSRLFRLRGGR
jgi:hypothetical protein